jgi:phospholipid/cholesterol/gamma-HCH transport system substrate-binding protein
VTRSLSPWQSVLLGVVVVIGTALGGVGLFAVGSRGWFGKDSLTVQAGFPEIRGVEVGTRVRIQGIDAGEVIAILPPTGPDSPVVLRLRVRGDYRHLIRNSSSVQIVAEGMLGGKVIEVRAPQVTPGRPAPDMRVAEEDTMLRAEPSVELSDIIGEVRDAVASLKGAKGNIDKLGSEAVGLMRNANDAVSRGKDTMDSIKRASDTVSKLPGIRGYASPDAKDLLIRAHSSGAPNRKVLAESDLFTPGRTFLSTAGKRKLDDEVGPWANALKHKHSEVIVVSYADPTKLDDKKAQSITQQQAEEVARYLKDLKVHSMSRLMHISGQRKVHVLGMGTALPPNSEESPLPPARVEVLVFVPPT